MLKILMFIYLFIFVVSISDYGIFIDRLSNLENIVSFSDDGLGTCLLTCDSVI